MSRSTIVFLAGCALVAVPFLGLPGAWITWIVVTIGVLLILVGYTLRRVQYLNTIDRGNGERGNDSFVESTAVSREDSPTP